MAFVGLTYAEIVSHVTKYVGNQSSDFNEYVRQTILLAEQRYLKMHDWSFLRRTDLSLPVTTGTAEYDLAFTVGPKNYTMAANEIETVRAESDNVVLKRVMLDEIRRLDPDNSDGSATDTPAYWAVAGQNRIRIWPPTTKNTTLKIDGKVAPEQPDYNSFGNEYPSIPLKFQEGFIEYVKAMALDRENDDRALSKKQEAMTLILQDIQSDLEIDNRIRSMEEFRYDGVSGLLNIPGFRPWD
jgi:hypothetical protein